METRDILEQLLNEIESFLLQRAEKRVRSLVNITNSGEFRNFLCQKKADLTRLLNELSDICRRGSVFSILQALRKLLHTDLQAVFCQEIFSQIFTASSFGYLMGRGMEILDDDNMPTQEKIDCIWDGLMQGGVDKAKIESDLESFLEDWKRHFKGSHSERERLSSDIKRDFEEQVKMQNEAIQVTIDSVRKEFFSFREALIGYHYTLWAANALNRDNIVQKGVRTVSTAFKIAPQTLKIVSEVFARGALLEGITGSHQAWLSYRHNGESRDQNRGVGRGTQATQGDTVETEDPEPGLDRFVGRDGKIWYPMVEKFICDYLLCKHTDSDLTAFLATHRLEEDRNAFRDSITKWIADTSTSIESNHLPHINETAAALELRRVWEFAKALVLDDETLHTPHLNALIDSASSLPLDESKQTPFFSLGWVNMNSDFLQIDFISPGQVEFEAICHALSQMKLQVIKSDLCGRIRVSACVTKAKASAVARQVISKFADLGRIGVSCVLLGEYSIAACPKVMNPAFNRIYGNGFEATGFKSTYFSSLDYSGEKYFCPDGFRRISLNVAQSREDFDAKYSGWHVAYHGTHHELAGCILTNGLRATVGAYSDGETVVYFSPSIRYSAHPRYSRVYMKDGKYFQMIFQVRVNPKFIWKKVQGTLQGSYEGQATMDKHFPDNQNLEWLVKALPGQKLVDLTSTFVIYGIMVRVYDSRPWELAENEWWSREPSYREAYWKSQFPNGN